MIGVHMCKVLKVKVLRVRFFLLVICSPSLTRGTVTCTISIKSSISIVEIRLLMVSLMVIFFCAVFQKEAAVALEEEVRVLKV